MDKKKTEPSFSLHEFRSWLSKHKEPKLRSKKSKSQIAESLIGTLVESRLGIKRLVQKITENNKTEYADIFAEEFKNNGGKIVEVNDLLVNVEVESGQFAIPKIYTKSTEPR